MSSPVRLPTEPRHTRELESLLSDLDADSLRWVSGFVAGLAAERARSSGAVSDAAPTAALEVVALRPRVTVLYASQTGNGRRIAEKLGLALEAAGFEKRVLATGDYSLKQLGEERFLYVVASTHGDGEPPDDARPLIDALAGRRAPKLEQLSFAVLGLGDSSYPQFCATARGLDARLAELGARRLTERVECDVDFDGKSTLWIQASLADLNAQIGAPKLTVTAANASHAVAPASHAATREAPVEVEVAVNQRITASGADKDVRHVELIAPEGRFVYQAGDAIGLWLDNSATLVDETLAAAHLEANDAVSVDGVTRPLKEWLTQHRELTRVARALIERLAALSGDAGLVELLRPAAAAQLRAQFKVWQVPDLLQRYPAQWTGERLVRALHPLSPRLYSIASAPEEVGEEVHITVAVVDDLHDGKRHLGAVSAKVQAFTPGARVRAFIEPNTRFRLPANPATSVIMIGPGTGVAPFRSFVQARGAQGATGRNWLFFGGRHFDQDFLYQTEWLAALKKGLLSRLDVAFSRDKSEKIYVQQRLREHSAEIYEWIETGAYIYVCGDAERMAPDVHAALVDIVATAGGRSREDAESYVSALAVARRYLRDVY